MINKEYLSLIIVLVIHNSFLKWSIIHSLITLQLRTCKKIWLIVSASFHCWDFQLFNLVFATTIQKLFWWNICTSETIRQTDLNTQENQHNQESFMCTSKQSQQTERSAWRSFGPVFPRHFRLLLTSWSVGLRNTLRNLTFNITKHGLDIITSTKNWLCPFNKLYAFHLF